MNITAVASTIFQPFTEAGPSGPGFIAYPDPTAATLLASGTPSDVDPTAVTVIDTPSADSDVDPTQVTIIQ